MVKLVNEPLHIPSDQLAAHRDRFYSQPRPFWLKDCSLADDLWIVELHNPKIRRLCTLRHQIADRPRALRRSSARPSPYGAWGRRLAA